MIKFCVICSKKFVASPSDRKVTCSKPCQRERARRANTAKGRKWSNKARELLSRHGQTQNLKLGTPAALKSPIAGPFETNINAKGWVVVSPEGKEYVFRNLNLWCREHEDILPGTAKTASGAFRMLKRAKLGKTKRAVTQWKGWILKSWSE